MPPTASAPWLAHYDTGVARTLTPYPSRTLADFLSDSARDRPDEPALLFKGASVSNRALHESSNAFAAALASLGVSRGDRVALLGVPCPEFVTTFLATGRVGGIWLGLNAKFTPDEADGLRKAMATFRRRGTIGRLEQKMVSRMVERGYDAAFAARCFNQIKGFGEYGFPESHAASFALLAYASAWMKRHHPAAFTAALLNSQPMGFYAPAQIIRDAREHGVEVRPVEANESHWDCTLEETFGGARALRLGFRQIKGFSEKDADKLVQARGEGYDTLRDAWRRSGLSLSALETLAKADAWAGLGLGRREALWEIKGLNETPLDRKSTRLNSSHRT